jgi:predicted Zn-dependent protease
MAEQRSEIHLRILELERGLRDEKKKQEVSIPLSSEIKLAKLRLVEEWPSQRAEISHRIESGQARDRKHGDVEDVGFRKWLQGQEKDIAVGDKAIREVKTSGRMPLETPLYSVQEYVQGLARKIAATSDLKVPLRVSVLDDPEVQSIALPGGFLFVTSGLVASARSESELAGTLAREIGKIAARHGTRSSKRAIIPKIFVPASQVATGFMTGGMTSAGAYYSMNYGFQGLGALMERAVTTPDSKLQKEADQLGIQYAWRAGFDPRGFIAFIDTITRDEDSPAAASILRTGSKFDQRMLDAFTEVQYLPPNSGTFEDSREFRMAQRALQN